MIGQNKNQTYDYNIIKKHIFIMEICGNWNLFVKVQNVYKIIIIITEAGFKKNFNPPPPFSNSTVNNEI